MRAKELLRRYRNGERDFRRADLSGESLRGFDLTGIDLSGANLTKTDLRGTKFANAKLISTQLCEARTGARRRWSMAVLLFALMLSGVAAFILGALVALFVAPIVEPSGSITGSTAGDIAFGVVGLVVIEITFYFSYRQGILATLGAFAVAFAVAFAIAFAVTGAVAFAVTGAVAFAVAFAVTGAVAFTVAGAIAFTVAGAVAFAVTEGSSNTPLIVALTLLIVLTATVLSFFISRRALAGDPRDKLIRDLAVGLSALGGTSFYSADLTDANFSHASLKSAHFRQATLTRTCFHLAQRLHLSRAYKTILADRTVLNLLVSHRPEPDKSYSGLNLKGANLSGAELADLDLTETDLSGATLEGADLQRANLTKVQALGTQFHAANLTAACLKAWNIDSTTRLEGAICEYVYLLRHQQERRPSSDSFAPGEFTKLFEEVLNTIDLIFRDGIDWRAFLETFQNIQVQHEDANLEIQSIENKGDGVMVVRLNASPAADKPAIHQAFKQGYQKALVAAERKYKAILQDREIQHKAEIIEIHRQQNTDMTRITELLAQRSTTIDVKATSQSDSKSNSKAMQGNDQSQNFDVQGDFTVNAENSIVSLRDVSGQVNNQINQLSGGETQTQLKDLLTQLQAAIETEPALSPDDKAEALDQVKTLAAAGQSPQAKQPLAKRAITMLKGITAGLTETTKLVGACSRLLPAIGLLFGL
ncbi:MAG: hypothetical protein F6J97_13560 [Leptolyngbya sp. SIO4C1]|nr:hypothetical protein [Leptolyngbya sp. SIO4C1]